MNELILDFFVRKHLLTTSYCITKNVNISFSGFWKKISKVKKYMQFQYNQGKKYEKKLNFMQNQYYLEKINYIFLE